MSIFFKFGVESGEPQKVTCDGMDMSLLELKLAIKDLKGIKNVTDFDLQVENGQSKFVYSDDSELISRGTTVLVKRVPLPHGVKKTWRQERSDVQNRAELSNLEVTSTSEEGRMDQVLAVSGMEYGKDQWERIRRPRQPRPLAGESLVPEKRYAHGIPSSMLVSAGDKDNNAAKVDKFGQLKLTAVELEGYGKEKIESHDWLKEAGDEEVINSTEKVSSVPKDLQCPLCGDLLSAAVLLPCCVAAACDECARNSLIESDHKCQLCGDKDVSPTDLIPNLRLRKKVAGFKNTSEETIQQRLEPLPKLLSGNNIIPAEIMLKRQKEEEAEKKKNEEKLVEAVIANINESDEVTEVLPETPADALSEEMSEETDLLATSPTEGLQTTVPSPDLKSVSVPPSAPATAPASAPASPVTTPKIEDREGSLEKGSSTPPPAPSEPDPVPDSTASPPESSETFSIESMSSAVPGQTIQTTYNNSYNTYHYPPGYYHAPDLSLPPPGYPSYYASTSYIYPGTSGKTYSYDTRLEEERWRKDGERRYSSRSYRYDRYRHRHRSRSGDRRDRDRDRSRDRLRDRDRERDRDRDRERYERRRRSRSRGREGRRDRHGSSKEETKRSDSKERSASPDRSNKRSKSGSVKKETNCEDNSPANKKNTDPSETSDIVKEDDVKKEETVDKKEEARLKLKELISKNRDKVEDVVRKKEKDGEKEKDLRAKIQSRKSNDRERKELQAELEREKKQREHESDGDWHCGDHHCRYINFKKNSVCKVCEKPPPETPVFWDITDPDKPKKKTKSKKSKKDPKEKRDSSQDSSHEDQVVKKEEESSNADTENKNSSGSRSQVTSFLDDIGDSFDDEISKHLRKCSSSPVKNTNDELEDLKTEQLEIKQEEFKSPMMNDSLKFEDVSSQDLSLSQDDSIGVHDNSIETESKDRLDPKHSWKDRSNTSGEFELTLEINDPEFLNTVKNEYRSSSPSWSNTKFKFPIKEVKTESKMKDCLPNLPDDISNSERSVSVRKRMEDQIRKEETDLQNVKGGGSKLTDEKTSRKEDPGLTKIKSDVKHKDRSNYRSSNDKSLDSSGKASYESSPRERRKNEEDRAAAAEKRKKDDRQRDRDRKERERHDRKREEEERQRRSNQRRREQLEEEKRKLDKEKKEISRKRHEEKKILESRKRSRSKSEDTEKKRKKEKSAAGDLRKRLDDMKKSPEKKVKKRESSSSSSSSSSSDSESEEDVVQKLFEDKKLLKKMLQLASASKKKKKKGKKKKKMSKDKSELEKPLHRRVVLSGRDQLTMQVSTSQEERSPSPVKKKKSKKSKDLSAAETLEINIKNNHDLNKAFDSPSPSPPRTSRSPDGKLDLLDLEEGEIDSEEGDAAKISLKDPE